MLICLRGLNQSDPVTYLQFDDTVNLVAGSTLWRLGIEGANYFGRASPDSVGGSRSYTLHFEFSILDQARQLRMA